MVHFELFINKNSEFTFVSFSSSQSLLKLPPLIFTLHQKILPLKNLTKRKKCTMLNCYYIYFVKVTEILLLEMTAGWMLIRVH